MYNEVIMRKILLILILGLLFLSGQVFATVVTQRKIQGEDANIERGSVQTTQQPTLERNIRLCRPYTETLNADYMGMNMSYKIQIHGWVNDKCVLDFTAQTQGMNSMLSELFGSDSGVSVMSFAPKIKCEFTKQQLEYVGDSLLEENSRSEGNRMLKDPNSIDASTFSNLSSSDSRLIDVVFNQRACSLTNTEDLNKMMQELYMY